MKIPAAAKALLLAASIGLTARHAAADVIHVDGFLQDAIDASNPGDVLLVESGVYPSIFVFHELTLIAVNGPVTIFDSFPSAPPTEPAVWLLTPAPVRLVGFEQRTINSASIGPPDPSQPAVVAMGHVELIECRFEVSTNFNGFGVSVGQPAMRGGSVVYLGNSVLRGGASASGMGMTSSGGEAYDHPVPGASAIERASSGDLIVNDSRLIAGAGAQAVEYTSESGADCGGFDPLTQGVQGAAAVEYGRVFVQSSDLIGGAGAHHVCCDGAPASPFLPATCTPEELTELGFGPTGPEVEGELSDAPVHIDAPHRISLGADLDVSVTLGSDPGFVVVGTSICAPLDLPGIGTLFVGADGSPVVIQPVGAGQSLLSTKIADSTQLIGKVLALQAWDGARLGVPHLTVIVP